MDSDVRFSVENDRPTKLYVSMCSHTAGSVCAPPAFLLPDGSRCDVLYRPVAAAAKRAAQDDFPRASDFARFEDYRRALGEWGARARAACGACVLPWPASGLLRRPMMIDGAGRGCAGAANEQCAGMQWGSWLIPAPPDPNFYDSEKDFINASVRWYRMTKDYLCRTEESVSRVGGGKGAVKNLCHPLSFSKSVRTNKNKMRHLIPEKTELKPIQVKVKSFQKGEFQNENVVLEKLLEPVEMEKQAYPTEIQTYVNFGVETEQIKQGYPKNIMKINSLGLFYKLLDLPKPSIMQKAQMYYFLINEINHKRFLFFENNQQFYKVLSIINTSENYIRKERLIDPHFDSLKYIIEKKLRNLHSMLFHLYFIQLFLIFLYQIKDTKSTVSISRTFQKKSDELFKFLETNKIILSNLIQNAKINEKNAFFYCSIFLSINFLTELFPSLNNFLTLFAPSYLHFYILIRSVSPKAYHEILLYLIMTQKFMQRFFLNFVECSKFYGFYFKNNGQDILMFLLKLKPNYISDNIYLNSEWTVSVVSVLSQLMNSKKSEFKNYQMELILNLIKFIEKCQKEKAMISVKWRKDIIKIQSIVMTFLAFYSDENKIVEYSLTILTKTIFDEPSYKFMHEKTCIPIIFQFLRNSSNKTFVITWKLIGQLFKIDLKSGINLLNNNTFRTCFVECIIQNEKSKIEVINILTEVLKDKEKKSNEVNISELLNVIKEAKLNPLQFIEQFEENTSKRAILIIDKFKKMLRKSPKIHRILQTYFVYY